MLSLRSRHMSLFGGRFALEARPRPRSHAGRWHCRSAAWMCSATTKSSRNGSGKRRATGGRTTTLYFHRGWAHKLTPHISGVPSERLSRRQDSTLTTGHLASYGTASSRCSPMLACRSSRSPAWLGTAGPQPPRRSTGSRFGRSSCTVPTSWTKSSQGGRLRMLSYSFSYSASVMARIHFGLHAL